MNTTNTNTTSSSSNATTPEMILDAALRAEQIAKGKAFITSTQEHTSAAAAEAAAAAISDETALFGAKMAEAQEARYKALNTAANSVWYKTTAAKVGFYTAGAIAVGAVAAVAYEHYTGNSVMGLFTKGAAAPVAEVIEAVASV